MADRIRVVVLYGGRSGEHEVSLKSAASVLHHLDRTRFEDGAPRPPISARPHRSEEHTSELQSRGHLVCRLLLEKKKKNIKSIQIYHKKKKITDQINNCSIARTLRHNIHT